MKVVRYTLNRKTNYSSKSYDLVLECGHTLKHVEYRFSEYPCWCEERYALGTIGVSGTGFSITTRDNDVEVLKNLISTLKTRVQPWVKFLILDRKTGEYIHQEKAQ